MLNFLNQKPYLNPINMKYTVSKKADDKIAKDIEAIKGIILKSFSPKAIILFGGFGHGGGSFREIGGKIIPLNDYDFYLITEKKIKDKELENLGEECSRAIGKGGLEIVERYDEKWDKDKFFHVDIHTVTEKRLKKLYPTQRTADLKTSMVIYGDEKILDKIPEIKISKSDAIRLLFNKLNHFAIAETNSEMLKSIYAVKGFTDSCSALLIYYGGYVSTYQERVKKLKLLKQIPKEYINLVEEATKAKLYRGYSIKNIDEFFEKSKKWVEWVLKKIIKEHLEIKSDDWKSISKIIYKKLPYIYFNDYLGSRYLFLGQYYLNFKFFLAGLRKREFLTKSLVRWRDAGIIIAIALMLYSFNEKTEAGKYLGKLTGKTYPLKERILKLYSIYYLQKLV